MKYVMLCYIEKSSAPYREDRQIFINNTNTRKHRDELSIWFSLMWLTEILLEFLYLTHIPHSASQALISNTAQKLYYFDRDENLIKFGPKKKGNTSLQTRRVIGLILPENIETQYQYQILKRKANVLRNISIQYQTIFKADVIVVAGFHTDTGADAAPPHAPTSAPAPAPAAANCGLMIDMADTYQKFYNFLISNG
uniref:Uncharacterized protein n=1 Tax=Glossina austeni TaxID=7395 RepID=A0A1A9UZR5_GLOAU